MGLHSIAQKGQMSLIPSQTRQQAFSTYNTPCMSLDGLPWEFSRGKSKSSYISICSGLVAATVRKQAVSVQPVMVTQSDHIPGSVFVFFDKAFERPEVHLF